MRVDRVFIKKMQIQALHLKMNIYRSVEYFMVMLPKKNEGLTRRIL